MIDPLKVTRGSLIYETDDSVIVVEFPEGFRGEQRVENDFADVTTDLGSVFRYHAGGTMTLTIEVPVDQFRMKAMKKQDLTGGS